MDSDNKNIEWHNIADVAVQRICEDNRECQVLQDKW